MNQFGITTARTFIVSALCAFAVTTAEAAPITPGNLLLSRVGDGSAALSSAGTAVFLDEYTKTGILVQSIAIPTSVSGANLALTMSGSATSEGGLAISQNGLYASFAGYNAAPGTANVTTTTSAATPRVVGILNLATGAVDTSTSITGAFSGGNIRGAVTDGTNAWAVGSSSGVQMAAVGSVGATTQVSSTVANLRRIEIFNGQLYVSASSGTSQGVSTVGSGTPTTTGQTTTSLPGFPTAAGPSSYDFVFSDPNTLYVADDRAIASGGGVQKWTLSTGTWSLAYTLQNGLSAGLRGLAMAGGVGNITLFGTTSTGSSLVAVTDTGATSSFNSIVTAPTNTAFRGLEVAPVPEPGTLMLFGVALLSGAASLRRRQVAG